MAHDEALRHIKSNATFLDVIEIPRPCPSLHLAASDLYHVFLSNVSCSTSLVAQSTSAPVRKEANRIEHERI